MKFTQRVLPFRCVYKTVCKLKTAPRIPIRYSRGALFTLFFFICF
nr:MAG TPA: hypothetical protein [Caudoviricetes sp.]